MKVRPLNTCLTSVLIFISWSSFEQFRSASAVDSLTRIIDQDKALITKSITLDTVQTVDGYSRRTEVDFVAFLDPITNIVRKIIWNSGGNYYSHVTIYYYQGFAVKGCVKAKYKETDTNPEFETNIVFYFQNNEISKEIELNGNKNRPNGFWYLTAINDFIQLARLTTQ